MAAINNGGPAFPTINMTVEPSETLDRESVQQMLGMSLRDWFAGQSLKGMLANPWIVQQPGFDCNVAVGAALAYADAMLKAREGR